LNDDPRHTAPAAEPNPLPMYGLLVLTMLVWGGYYVVIRALNTQLTAGGFNFWRWAIVTVILAGIGPRELWAARRVVRRHWPILLALGATGIAAFPAMVVTALHSTTATNGALVISNIPVAIFGLSWLINRERATARQLLAIPLSLAGIVTIITRGRPGRLLEVDLHVGDLWMIAAVLSWALYAVLVRRAPAGLRPLTMLAVLAAFGTLALLPLYGWELARGEQTHLFEPPVLLLAMAYLTLLVSILGFTFYNIAITHIGANRSGLFNHLVPVFTIVLASLLLDEQLHGFHAIGIALIAAGIWLCTGGGRK